MRAMYPGKSRPQLEPPMLTLELSSIRIPENRQRAVFDDEHISDLMTSIKANGLINPLVVREGNVLVAGECRLRAISLIYKLGGSFTHASRDVPAGHVPVIDFGSLSPLAQMELEYAENAFRRDLSWQENAKAIASLHELRGTQKAELPGAAPQSFADTAQELFHSVAPNWRSKVSDSLAVVKNLSDPDIAKASSFKEAKKILARKGETARREVLAGLIGRTSVSDRFKVYQADCITWMKEQPDGQFDVILTDPPYGMDADAFGDAAGRMAGINHEYTDDAGSALGLLRTAIPEFYRLAKPESHLYLWCDIEHFLTLRNLCREAGFWTFRTPLVNLKPEGGRVPWPEHGPRRSYEICLFGVKGKRVVNSIRPDYFESRLTEGNFGHGAQKPVEAYVELLKRSVRPGDTVFDPFAGTGTIFAAAAATSCRAVGVEQETAAYGICLERIGGLS